MSKNDSGTGSRGYWIFRRGRTVIIRYGPVHVRRSKHVWIVWSRQPREVRKRVGSATAARDLMKAVMLEKTNPNHGYTRLKPGVRIR